MRYLKIFIFLLLPFSLFSQETKDFYRIVDLLTDNYYYNAVLFKENIYLGSANGVFFYNRETKEAKIYDSSIKGNISVFQNKIVESDVLVDNEFNFLLPEQYKAGNANYLINSTDLFIVTRGVVFVFEVITQNIEIYPSVRSISKNYIGTYGGIYNKGNKNLMEFPSYSNSYIREFEEETFVNWDGLTIYRNDKIINLFDPSKKEISIENKNLGKARDVIKDFNNSYILSTTNGLYTFNSKTLKNKLIVKATNGVFYFLNKERYNGKLLNIYFNDDFNFYQYNIVDDNLIVLKSFKDEVKDIFYNLKNEFFVLFENKAIKYYLNSPKKEKIILEDLDLTHNIDIFKNFIFVTSNLGISFYDLKTGAYKVNIIKDEFNDKAYYKNDKTLFIGSINGLLKLDYNEIIKLFYLYKEPSKNSNLIISKKVGVSIILVIIIIILVIYFYLKKSIVKKINLNNDKDKLNETLIRNYIIEHLNTVNINSICDEFKISTNKLYSILNKNKPGDIIREERLKVVRKMRKQNISENRIAKITGFSISYLKKI